MPAPAQSGVAFEDGGQPPVGPTSEREIFDGPQRLTVLKMVPPFRPDVPSSAGVRLSVGATFTARKHGSLPPPALVHSMEIGFDDQARLPPVTGAAQRRSQRRIIYRLTSRPTARCRSISITPKRRRRGGELRNFSGPCSRPWTERRRHRAPVRLGPKPEAGSNLQDGADALIAAQANIPRCHLTCAPQTRMGSQTEAPAMRQMVLSRRTREAAILLLHPDIRRMGIEKRSRFSQERGVRGEGLRRGVEVVRTATQEAGVG